MSSPTDEEINAAIGQRIRDVRKAAGLTQGDLAETLGRTKTAVSYMESGKTAINASQIYRIAARVGCHPAELFVLNLPMAPPSDAGGLLIAMGTLLRSSQK